MKNLILFPTQMEHDACVPALAESCGDSDVMFRVCGFGPISAGIESARLIQEERPARVLLVGIAGTYGGGCLVGDAYSFNNVACDAVGTGSGEKFQTAGGMGWAQWPGSEQSDPIGDEIRLSDGSAENLTLLTVGSASADSTDVKQRLVRWPDAVAEDMEGFAVAMAAARARISLRIVRGISNQAGDREHSNWQIAAALKAATFLATDLLRSEN